MMKKCAHCGEETEAFNLRLVKYVDDKDDLHTVELCRECAREHHKRMVEWIYEKSTSTYELDESATEPTDQAPIVWTADKCDVFEDIEKGEIILRAEVRIRRWDRDADQLKELSEGRVIITSEAALDGMAAKLDERDERIRALEKQLGEVTVAIEVLRGLGGDE